MGAPTDFCCGSLQTMALEGFTELQKVFLLSLALPALNKIGLSLELARRAETEASQFDWQKQPCPSGCRTFPWNDIC